MNLRSYHRRATKLRSGYLEDEKTPIKLHSRKRDRYGSCLHGSLRISERLDASTVPRALAVEHVPQSLSYTSNYTSLGLGVSCVTCASLHHRIPG